MIIKRFDEKIELTPLNCEKYKKHLIRYEEIDNFGYHWTFDVGNNRGLSVLKQFGSWGWMYDLFEIAIIGINNEYIKINPIGNCEHDEVLEYLDYLLANEGRVYSLWPAKKVYLRKQRENKYE